MTTFQRLQSAINLRDVAQSHVHQEQQEAGRNRRRVPQAALDALVSAQALAQGYADQLQAELDSEAAR